MKNFLLLLFLVFIGIKSYAQNYNWHKRIGGTGDQNITSMFKNPTGIFICGTFTGSVDFDPSSSDFILTTNASDDGFIAKYDFNGNFLWAKALVGNDNASYVVPKSLTADNSSIYIAGDFSGTIDFNPSATTTNSTSNGRTDIFYLKLNNNGDYLYHKTIGGNSFDKCNEIVLDKFLIPYITGNFKETVDFNPDAGVQNITATNTDSYVTKINPSNGVTIWTKTFASTTTGNTEATALAVDGNGNIFVGGTFNETINFNPTGTAVNETANTGYLNSFLVKLNDAGNYSFHRRLLSNGSNKINDIKIDHLNNVAAGGYISSGSTFLTNTPNSYYPTAGISASTQNFVWKLNNNLEFFSVNLFLNSLAHSTNASETTEIMFDAVGNIYMIAKFYSSIYIPNTNGSGQTLVYSSTIGKYDVLVAKLATTRYNNSILNVLSAVTYGGNQDTHPSSLTINNDQIFVVGNFEGTTDFDPSNVTMNSTSAGLRDVFLQRFSDVTLSTSSDVILESSIYPNPVTNVLHIQTNSDFFSYKLYAIDGKLIKSGISNTNFLKLNLDEVSKGMYLFEMNANNKKTVQKILKQ